MVEQIKQCKICGKDFSTASGFKTYCSIPCRQKGKKLWSQNYGGTPRVQKKKESELARINAEARAMGMNYGKYMAMMELRKAKGNR